MDSPKKKFNFYPKIKKEERNQVQRRGSMFTSIIMYDLIIHTIFIYLFIFKS